MATSVWPYALQAVGVFSSVIAITAALIYYRRVRVRASLWVAIGALGGFLTNAALTVVNFIIGQRLAHPFLGLNALSPSLKGLVAGLKPSQSTSVASAAQAALQGKAALAGLGPVEPTNVAGLLKHMQALSVLQGRISIAGDVVGLFFGFLFSISLLLVLLDASRRLGQRVVAGHGADAGSRPGEVA